MNTQKAMEECLNRKTTKKKYKSKPNTLTSIACRFRQGKMSLDAQIKFLNGHGYSIKQEIDWRRPAPVKHQKKELIEQSMKAVSNADQCVFDNKPDPDQAPANGAMIWEGSEEDVIPL